MFENDLSELPTRDLLEAAAECRAIAGRADARVLECAQIFADRTAPAAHGLKSAQRAYDGRERAVVLGGEGCPEIAEFAIAEFAVVLGVSPGVGRQILADGLALRHRFPQIWERIQTGEATPWKACQIVRSCVKLCHVAAAYVDRRVAPLVDTISPYRLDKIVAAAKKYADAELAEEEAAEATKERGVFIGRADDHGTKTMYVKAAASAVNRHNATISAIADALQTFGDRRSVQHRRAEAIGIIADPTFTQELLTRAQLAGPTNTSRPATKANAAADSTGRTRTSPENTANPASTPSPASTSDATRTATAAGAASDASAAATGCAGSADGMAEASRAGASPRTSPGMPSAASEASAARFANAVGAAGAAGAAGTAGTAGTAGAAAGQDSCAATKAKAPGHSGRGDSVEEDLLQSDPHEPVGPPEDPWLEASAPHDPDILVDRFDDFSPDPHPQTDEERPMDAAALKALHTRLAQIRQDAYANPSRSGVERPKGQVCPRRTDVVVHLTDRTLATGTGVVRAEGIGPLLAGQLAELIGYGPYVVKPVIDLNDAVSVDAYEIPTRIRERVRLMHPVELFPYGTRESSDTIDLDHIEPYDPLGPAGQTSTGNLAPLGRFGHRVKTHARGWSVHRIDFKTLEWGTPHGFRFRVGPDGTYGVDPSVDKTAVIRRAGLPGG
ncbi:hypothetical protein [Kribbella sp. NPDC048915]|uniref:hypothetical protein n=1 Tax=Kribbella sp. NPDC048915 TaxID=3155148 RepID=UPI003408E872